MNPLVLAPLFASMILAPSPPKRVQKEIRKIFGKAKGPALLRVKEDFKDPRSHLKVLDLPGRVDLRPNVGVRKGRLWLGVRGPRMVFKAGLKGFEAVCRFHLEATVDPGNGVATFLLGSQPDGSRFRLDFRAGPAFDVGVVGPKGGRFLIAPRRHRALRSYPARIGILRGRNRLWVWTRGEVLAVFKFSCAPGGVGLQVSSGGLDGCKAWFDDLFLEALAQTARVKTLVLASPQGPPVPGFPVFATWRGGAGVRKLRTGPDGGVELVIPIGPLVKIWTGADGTGVGWVRFWWPPAKESTPRSILVLPGQGKRVDARFPDKVEVRFSFRGIRKVPASRPASRPVRPGQAASRPREASSSPASRPASRKSG